MASRNHFTANSLHPETVLVTCSFAPNGTGAPAAASNEGPINTVTRTGVGTFQVTFKDAFPGMLSAQGTVQLAASGNTIVQFGTYTPASRTLVVRTLTGGVDADVAAGANNRVHLLVAFRNTTNTVKS